jgi:multimeric flavodoxin WrbA
MRIIACIGSHRKNGNTARAVALLEKELRTAAEENGAPLTVETVFLHELHIEPCRGCRACFDRGEDLCPHKDDLLSLRDRIMGADAALFASPVYVNDVTGTMKTLIDRLAFLCHRPALHHVPACFLATTGGSPTRHTLHTLQGAWLSMGGPSVAALGLKAGALTGAEEMQRHYGRKLKKLARLVLSRAEQKMSSRPGFGSLLVFCIQQKARRRLCKGEKTETIDARYWRERGWFDMGCTFFVPHRAPFFRVTAARALGTLLARVF